MFLLGQVATQVFQRLLAFTHLRMAQGRCSLIFATDLLLGLFFHSENVWATDYLVGGNINGWTFNVEDWLTGRNFTADDTLGKYEPSFSFLFFKLVIPEIIA